MNCNIFFEKKPPKHFRTSVVFENLPKMENDIDSGFPEKHVFSGAEGESLEVFFSREVHLTKKAIFRQAV